MYCRPSYNILFIYFFFHFYFFLFFFIVRRPWPNFVCKGRRTGSVVLYYCIILYGIAVLMAGSPLAVSIASGSDVVSIKCPSEPALIDCVNCIAVNKNQQNEGFNLSQCLVKVTGTSL